MTWAAQKYVKERGNDFARVLQKMCLAEPVAFLAATAACVILYTLQTASQSLRLMFTHKLVQRAPQYCCQAGFSNRRGPAFAAK